MAYLSHESKVGSTMGSTDTPPAAQNGQSEHAARQVIGSGPARYEMAPPPTVEPEVCRYCAGDIVPVKGQWWAVRARWPNLAHCHYSARNGTSVGHEPEAG